MAIHIFVTGGTFDKEYDEIEGTLSFRETHLQEMLKKGRCKIETNIRTLMMVDSLDMTQEERESIRLNCEKAKEDRILITHGTDTMVETAEVLSTIKNKTIVITGAMTPYAFGSSDGLFNLGSALAFTEILPPGVYITMNGRYFLWNNVKKNKKTGEFEETKK
jgi:L-asparaginase